MWPAVIAGVATVGTTVAAGLFGSKKAKEQQKAEQKYMEQQIEMAKYNAEAKAAQTARTTQIIVAVLVIAGFIFLAIKTKVK